MNICLQNDFLWNDLSQDIPRIISPAVFIADAHYKTNGAGGDVVRVDFDSGANVDSHENVDSSVFDDDNLESKASLLKKLTLCE